MVARDASGSMRRGDVNAKVTGCRVSDLDLCFRGDRRNDV